MKIQLHFQEHAQGQVAAGFLRGDDLADWLPELERWGIALEDLRCYVVPQSLADRRPAGLLAILPSAAASPTFGNAIPCYFASKQLLLPLDATLHPAMTAAELELTLRFPIMLLHPTLGLVGWEADERLDFAPLLSLGHEQTRDWSFAHPGNAPAPPLHEVKVPQPSAEETLNELLGGVDRRPLSELGDDPREDDSPWSRFKAGLFKGGLSMTKGLMDTLPEGSGEGGAGFEALSKLAAWLGSMGGGLGTQREDALDKLMDLFDKNPDQALRYAIPLDNPFQNRGLGAAGGSLQEKNTTFDFGRLGGGLGGNTWGVDSRRYQSLRERYQKAANEAIAAGEYEKAAYIYAHLLHDLQGAANVLQQGKHYREAAAIYREHLKNPLKAAECLELGGLYLDAIDIYLTLDRWEKAGDLYAVIGKKVKADAQYERCVEAALAKADFLEAARLLEHKMKRMDRTLVTLLQGWQDEKQSENCLKCYLQLVAGDAEVDMAHQLDMLYRQHTPATREVSLLTVMAGLMGEWKDAATKEMAKAIVYEVLSRRTLQGDPQQLQLLARFVEGDSLVANDVSRFNASFKKPQEYKPASPPNLNKNIQWLGCKAIGNQMLAYGREGNHLWMARFNWQMDVEYYHWPERLEADETVYLLTSAQVMDKVLICSSRFQTFSIKVLPANDRFTHAIETVSPNLIGEDMGRVLALSLLVNDVEGDYQIAALVQGLSYATVKHFDLNGALLYERHCKQGDELLAFEPGARLQPMLAVRNSFVVLTKAALVFLDMPSIGSLATHYEVEQHPLSGEGHQMDVDGSSNLLLAAVATTQGCNLVLHKNNMPIVSQQKALLQTYSIDQVHFLPGDLLVITYPKYGDFSDESAFECVIYAGKADARRLQMKIALDFRPQAIIPGPNRRTFGLLARTGQIVMHTVEESLDGWN